MGQIDNKEQILRNQISELVAKLHDLRQSKLGFERGKSKVSYGGRVYGHKEMDALVQSAVDFWLTAGPKALSLEKKIKKVFDAQSAYLVNSGSSANLLMVAGLCNPAYSRQLRAGDEVITPALTFPTTLAPLVQYGLTPVFVDVELDTYNIDADLIEGAISPRSRAIFIPHTLGNPCRLEIITHLAKKHNLLLIEDTCDALGSLYDEKLVGSFGQMASLSFYPSHHITMGEGGAVVINEPELDKIALALRDWGRDCYCKPGQSNCCGKRFSQRHGLLPYGYDHKYVYSQIGYNLKLTDMQAAIGLVQWDRLGEFVSLRKRNFSWLYEKLSAYPEFLALPRWDSKASPAWFGLPIRVTGKVTSRELTAYLEKAKIETRKIFAGNILKQPGFASIKHRVFGSLENTDIHMRDSFFIGVYPGLTEGMLEYIVETFEHFFHD